MEETKKIIKLGRNFLFADIFNQQRNVNKLELFASGYFCIPIEEVRGNLELIGRKLEKRTKDSAWKEVDLLLKLKGKLLKINIEINSNGYQNVINRNVMYLCTVSSTNYKEGDKNYANIWKTHQLNFNVFGKKNNKLLNEYVLKEKESNDILTDRIQVDVINMEMVNEVCYNDLNDKEKVIYQFCKMLMCETPEEFKKWSELLMSVEESEELLNQVEEKSNDDGYVYMESTYQSNEDYLADAIKEERAEILKQGLEQGIEQGIEQGVEQKTREDAINFYKNGASEEMIMRSLNISKETLQEYLKSENN